MEDEIKKISSGEIQNHLLKKWKKDTDEEEEKSESGPRRRSFMIIQKITGPLN